MTRRRLLATATFAAVAIGLSAVSAASAAGCASGTTCAVGGAGTGGQASDGNAQGFRLAGPSTGFPGSTFTNQGNQMAGNITLTGTASGSGSGAFTPQGVLVGHYDGVTAGFFGTTDPCSGICG